MKIARYIQQAGLASRREAEAWVRDGRVRVDGVIVRTPASVLDEGARILLDGKPLPRSAPTQLWLYHKPAGLIVTRRDPQNRPTIFSALPKQYQHSNQNLIAVGRLDVASEGLLLLTNDGALARQLELPANGLARHYRVRVFGAVTQERLDRLATGVVVQKIRYAPVEAELEKSSSGRNRWIKIILREGKNREVRVLMESLGLQVNRLIRTGFGRFRLGRLPRGAIELAPASLLRAQQKELT